MRKSLTEKSKTLTAQVNALGSNKRAAVSVMVAVGVVPLLVSIGVATDMARSVAMHAALQSVADAAALAGTNAYTDDGQLATAKAVAQAYLDKFTPTGMTITGTTVTAAPKTVNGSSYNAVTVTASATVSTTLLQVVNSSQVKIQVKAVAGISPTLTSQVVCGLATGCPSQLTAGGVKSSALDFNSVYLYGVPKDSSGVYQINQIPSGASNYWEVGSNCNSYVDRAWTSQSRCNSAFGHAVSNTQPKVFVLPPDQPIAMVFVNQNNGMSNPGSNGYGTNQFGADPGNIVAFFTAYLSFSTPAAPSSGADGSVGLLNYAFGLSLPSQTTNYKTTYTSKKTSTLSNCAVQIVQVLDPANPPTTPPYPGQCLAPNDPKSGYQYANLSCNQIAGRTFMYWWNDMGAPTDDLDYQNISYMLTCKPGVTNTDGGTIGQGNGPLYSVAGLMPSN